MTKIKILVDAHVFDHSFQGTATYIKGLYNSLVNDDCFEITLCAHNIENIKVHFPNERFRFIQLKSESKIKRLLIEIPGIIRRNEFDFAHFQYIVPFVKNCKFIVTVHDVLFLDYKSYFPFLYRLKNGLLFKHSANRSDIVLTVSQYSKDRISEKFGIKGDSIFVTPNAVEQIDLNNLIDVKSKYNLKKYILFVSRFEPRKNQKGLLKAYINLKLFNQGYSLVFIGSKNEKIEQEEYDRLMLEIPQELKSNIKFFENMPFDDLFSFYKYADCFVYPSFAEGFGIPPIEAANLNCKVLCSNKTAMKDFSFFKYTFNPENQQEFEQKLNAVLEDKSYPFGEIKKEVNKIYDWDNIAFNFGELIKKNKK
jgi:glycosyltransferase involved in cell wall biosynthesis